MLRLLESATIFVVPMGFCADEFAERDRRASPVAFLYLPSLLAHVALSLLSCPSCERQRNLLLRSKIHANLAFQACTSFLRCFRTGSLRKWWQFPILFTGVYLVFEVFQTSGAFLFLPCSHTSAVAHVFQMIVSALCLVLSLA